MASKVFGPPWMQTYPDSVEGVKELLAHDCELEVNEKTVFKADPEVPGVWLVVFPEPNGTALVVYPGLADYEEVDFNRLKEVMHHYA